jgi:hypothetical protein
LLTAWKIVCAACAILVFSASAFGPRVLAVHSFKTSEEKAMKPSKVSAIQTLEVKVTKTE